MFSISQKSHRCVFSTLFFDALLSRVMKKTSSDHVQLASSAAKHPQLIESVGQHGQSSTLVVKYYMDYRVFIRLAEAGESSTAFVETNGIYQNLCSDSFFKWATYRSKFLHDRSWPSGMGSPTTTCSVRGVVRGLIETI